METNQETALKALRDYIIERDRAEERITYAVMDARSAGASWQKIAYELGITKQRAHQIYAAVSTPRNTSRDDQYTPEENAEADKALAAMRAVAARKADEDHAQHVEATAIFLDGTVPASEEFAAAHATADRILAAERKAKAAKKKQPEAMTAYQEFRPIHQLPGDGSDTAQRGTGKGPHQCPNCGQNNHKTGTRPDTQAAFYEFCTPTKYDTPAITAYMKEHTK